MGNLLNCDSLLTADCRGATDPRYDSSVSNNLIDQEPLWSEYAGHWGPETRKYSIAGKGPRTPTFYNPDTMDGWPYKSDDFVVYRYITVEGTRFKSQAFYFYGPAPAEFCDQIPPEGTQNTIGDGICGQNGALEIVEQFGVSSYEKDGTINIIWQSGGSGPSSKSGPPVAETSTITAVDDNAVFWYLDIPKQFSAAETFTFTGEDRDLLMGVATGTDLKHEVTDENFLRIVSSSLSPKMAQDKFFPALQQAFEEYNVKDVPEWVSNGTPLPNCVAGCPSENDWCSTGKDPGCSISPYQEPTASLNGGGITVVVLCVIAALSTVFFFLHRHLSKKQKNRYRTQFAEQITQDVGHIGSIEQLGPEELAEEFRRIDADNSGLIEKDELWGFVSSGAAGTMTRKDFEALFTAMDVDGNSMVSFMEFCSFMATCGKSYQCGSSANLMEGEDAADQIARLIDVKKIN